MRVAAFVLKLVISLVLLAWLLSRQPLDEIRLALAHPVWPWLAAALAVYGISAVGGAMQWAWLLRAAGLRTPVLEILRLYLVGLFFNNFLPANVGGDAYKIFDLGRREHSARKVFAATLVDRLVGLTGLTVLALLCAGLAWLGGIGLPAIVGLLAAVLGLLVGVIGLLLSRRLGPRVPSLLERLRLDTLAEQIRKLVAELQVFRRQPGLLARILGFSVAVQGLRILTHVLVGYGLGLALAGAQVLQLFVLVPMLAISLTLPVTVNGIGLRETVSAYLLPWAGLAPQAVIALEMTAFLVQVAFSLTGGVLFWMGWRVERSRAAAIRREPTPGDGFR